jgi:hypothetical protein
MSKNSIKIGNYEIIETHPLYDSTFDYQAKNIETLQQRLNTDGYLFLKNIIPLNEILLGRMKILNYLYNKKYIEGEVMRAKIAKEKNGQLPSGWVVIPQTG